MKKQPSRDREAPYSDKLLAEYGRRLTRDDIRLVQAFRGLPATKRAALLEDTSLAVLTHAQEPPAGLVAAFKLIDMKATAIAARSNAEETFPHAARIIEILNTDRDSVDRRVQDELDRAAVAIYGDVENPDVGSFTAFHVGFAVCWLLMMAVNGKDGAR